LCTLLGTIDKLAAGHPMRKAFGKFNAHLDLHDEGLLRVGNRLKLPEGTKDRYAGYNKAGMERAFREWRRVNPSYREADAAAEKAVAAVRPIETRDLGHLYESGGTISTKTFVYALSRLRLGEPADYVAVNRAEMARFAAFVDKYYPGMETRITRAPGKRGEWHVNVMRAGEHRSETGAQWARDHIGTWANRFDYGGIASVVENLGKETITITIPAKKDGTPRKPPIGFIQMMDMRSRKLKPSLHFESELAQKGITVTVLPAKIKTRSEYYGGKKREIPVSYTYAIVLDGTKTRDALMACAYQHWAFKKEASGPPPQAG